MITFFVTGQSLNVSQPVIAADTIDYLEATMLFQTQNWAECNSIWAHFKQGEKVFDIALRNGKIEKEQHLNLGAGEWLVYLHGTTAKGTRITTTEAKMTVQKTGMLGESPLPEIPLSVAEQISQIAQSVRDDANAGKFDGGYYTVKASISDNNLVLTFTASKKGMKEIPPQSVHIDVGEVDPETIRQAVEKYLKENPINVPVTSVNGKTGKVELTAKDVKALPDSTKIPTKTSELTNDAGFLTAHQSLADYAKKTEIPKSLSQLSEDATHRVVTDTEKATWNGKSNFSGKWQDLKGKPDIPTKLPNPNKLTFNGAVTATYDGSSAVTVTIPQGGSSPAGGTTDHRQLTHRDDADQHKIQAITGLQSALDGKQSKGNYALKSDKLANPHALTINGQQYDGSKAVSVEIKGGEGSGGEKPWRFVRKFTATEPITKFEETKMEPYSELFIKLEGLKSERTNQFAINGVAGPHNEFIKTSPTTGFILWTHDGGLMKRIAASETYNVVYQSPTYTGTDYEVSTYTSFTASGFYGTTTFTGSFSLYVR